MKTRQHIAMAFVLLLVASTPLSAFAEIKTLTAEATYTMGDGETPAFAEAMVLQKAKQMALEQAGTYVQSYTNVRNMDLTLEEITTIAGGVLLTEILEKRRALIGDGVKFDIKIKAIVSTDRMEELARKLRGQNIPEEYKILQQQYAALMQELNSLKASLPKTPAGPERDAALDRIREQERSFRSLQKTETALFKKLVSGDALFFEALSQVSQKESERDLVDGLYHKVLEDGYEVSLGDPRIQATLQSRESVIVSVPVSIQVTPLIKMALSETARQLGGPVVKSSFTFDGKFITPKKGLAVRLGNDPETVRHFQTRMSNTVLYLEAQVNGLRSQGCYLAPDYLFNHVSTLGLSSGNYEPFNGYKNSAHFEFDNGFVFSSDFGRTLKSGEGYILALDEPVSFVAEMHFPLNIARQITSFTGKVAEGIRASKYEKPELGKTPCGVSK